MSPGRATGYIRTQRTTPSWGPNDFPRVPPKVGDRRQRIPLADVAGDVPDGVRERGVVGVVRSRSAPLDEDRRNALAGEFLIHPTPPKSTPQL